MSDIVDRLRAIPVWMAGAMTPGWQEHGTSAYEAADLIESLRAENARLTEERDALVEGLQWYAEPHIYAPHPNGPAFDDRDLSWHARSVLAKVKPEGGDNAPDDPEYSGYCEVMGDEVVTDDIGSEQIDGR